MNSTIEHLDPARFRTAPKHLEGYYGIRAPDEWITRENVDALLDAGHIEIAMLGGIDKWWRIRRNGKTRTWKKDPRRIRIPFKMGLYGYGALTERDFIT